MYCCVLRLALPSDAEVTVQSCEDGESVVGLSAEVDYLDSADSTYDGHDTYEYVITSVELVCSPSGKRDRVGISSVGC